MRRFGVRSNGHHVASSVVRALSVIRSRVRDELDAKRRQHLPRKPHQRSFDHAGVAGDLDGPSELVQDLLKSGRGAAQSLEPLSRPGTHDLIPPADHPGRPIRRSARGPTVRKAKPEPAPAVWGSTTCSTRRVPRRYQFAKRVQFASSRTWLLTYYSRFVTMKLRWSRVDSRSQARNIAITYTCLGKRRRTGVGTSPTTNDCLAGVRPARPKEGEPRGAASFVPSGPCDRLMCMRCG